MRKISELLEICKSYHELWGGSKIGMRPSSVKAGYLGEITKEERYEVTTHSMVLVEEIDPESVYLYEALCFDRTHEPDRRQLKDWQEDHINTLKENGL